MKNLLIKPSSFILCSGTSTPLGLLYMAAMDRGTDVLDLAIHKVPVTSAIRSKEYKVVGVQVYTPSRKESLQILNIARNLGCVTVAGGPHVAVMRKQMESYDFIDYLVIGDGEYAWRDITRAQTDPSIHPKRTIRCPVGNLDDLPIPIWSKIDVNRYNHNRVSVVLGRGCDGQCTFCSAWSVNGRYRHHSGRWLYEHLEEIAKHSGYLHLVFQDDCLTNTESGYDALIYALKKFQRRNFRFTGTTRVDRITREQIKELKRLGFYSLGFGIESGSQTILEKINKQTDLHQALKVREWCKQEGMHFKALMMTGFPFETIETRQEDREFRKKLQPDEWGSVGHIMVLPGTKLYRDLKKEGRISDEFWLGDSPYYRLG